MAERKKREQQAQMEQQEQLKQQEFEQVQTGKTKAASSTNRGKRNSRKPDGKEEEKMGEQSGMTLEQSMEKLEEVLSRMEQDTLPLEEAFALYKQGMDLLLSCNQAIDKVEKELLVLEEGGVDEGV